jgi:hypothetical protein
VGRREGRSPRRRARSSMALIGAKSRSLVLALVGALWWLVPLGLLGWFVFQALTFHGEACQTAEAGRADEPGSVEAPDGPVTLQAGAGGDALDVVIPNQHTLTRTIALVPSDPLPSGQVLSADVEGDLVRTDRSAIFSEEQVVPHVRVEPDGGQITLIVCFAGSSPRQVDAGKYEGAIQIRGPGVEELSIPVIATVRFPNGWIAWIVAFLSVGLGLLAKGLGDIATRREGLPDPRAGGRVGRSQRTQRRETLFHDLTEYFREPLTVVSGILGLGLAAYAVFTLYLANPTFGGPQDWVTLATFCFLSLVGGFSIAEFAAVLGQSAPPRMRPAPGATTQNPEPKTPSPDG